MVFMSFGHFGIQVRLGWVSNFCKVTCLFIVIMHLPIYQINLFIYLSIKWHKVKLCNVVQPNITYRICSFIKYWAGGGKEILVDRRALLEYNTSPPSIVSILMKM